MTKLLLEIELLDRHDDWSPDEVAGMDHTALLYRLVRGGCCVLRIDVPERVDLSPQEARDDLESLGLSLADMGIEQEEEID